MIKNKFITVKMFRHSLFSSKNSLSRFFSAAHNKAILIDKINAANCGEEISVQGWIQNVRKMKSYLFMDVNDGSCSRNLQLVVPRALEIQVDTGCSVEAIGKLTSNPTKEVEMQVAKLRVLGNCKTSDGYPFTPKQKHPAEFLREYLHLRARNPKAQAIFRIRHRAAKAIHDFFDEEKFIHIHTPILTSNDCEGAGEIFLVKPESKDLLKNMVKPGVTLDDGYFDKPVFLSVSGQFHLEAMSHGFGNTYTFNPAFRAENSRSTLHLCEFYMLEAELSFATELHQISQFVEKMVKTVTKNIYDKCEADLMLCKGKDDDQTIDQNWLTKPWPTITYDNAIEILKHKGGDFSTPVKENESLSKEHELFLVKYVGTPVFVIDWPSKIKPFYMKQTTSHPNRVEALDLLTPIVGELAGGSLREDCLERLLRETPKELNWYLELRKFGGIPTGGFGLGFERYLQLLTGVMNIKDVIPFPRWAHNCSM